MGTPKHLKLSLLFLLALGLASTSAVTPSTLAPVSSSTTPPPPPPPPPPPAPPPATCNPGDRNALLKIKQAFNSNFVLLDGWQPDSNCCKGWTFVECNSLTGRVNSLTIYGAGFFGVLELPPIFPPAIGDLSYLSHLVFQNNVQGLLPAALFKLQRLNYLDLSGNRFSGPIPHIINRLRDLNYLNLLSNELNGSIPTQLSNLPHLGYINLQNNKLTGRIPHGLFRLYKGAPYLILSSNRLTGPIPKALARVNFWGLDLADNMLTGSASFAFGKDKALSYLDLSRNALSFDMSKLEVPSRIVTLRLHHNKIFGRLPTSLTAIVDGELLDSFSVSYNLLCGQIPVGGKLQLFDASVYSNNKCLCGTPLPPCK